MEAFRKLDAIAASLRIANVDTDQIIPARYLGTSRSVDHGQFLFHDMRRRGGAEDQLSPDFVLNQQDFSTSSILVADANFGCGSSRESAVYALWDAGIRCVIAPSFGDIFYSNATKNGLLPIVLDRETVKSVWRTLDTANSNRLEIDLESQTVHLPDGRTVSFEIEPFKKQALLDGLDDIDLTLGLVDEIEAHEDAASATRPWSRAI